ncbi:DUF6215 domain-containing protein [Streptomyces xanthophaeus]|uniref:Uncharacterized protein n=1 Tax=Streptomyces xanthophaeus TaxID=67385 RepID=A0A919GYJ8_9ACTN|nr:DUF6215 domain-containing protein [Streptomyces xanthophaeus]WST25051.1 DUF6215 domain-containing protein [Streptomyces xanthophaeus]WST59976.1 DUF6215 domain-containing protein [Streptomyces xanthophaeus]GHI86980.1 hypothetical protein Sxan_43440 [Streptomyces xanthophaeus]
MAGILTESLKGMGAGAQALAAVVVVGGGGFGLWLVGDRLGNYSVDREPAVCSVTEDVLPQEYVSGAQLCTALNRPDLPELLGTPGDETLSAGGQGRWGGLGRSAEIAASEAKVSLTSYAVQLSASYDQLPVGRSAELLGPTAQKTTVLGHPSVLYSDRTIAISFGGGTTGSTHSGGIARSLVVALDPKDGGGSYEVTIWRKDGTVPDDAALFRVAEQVLPTVPGWTAG